MIGRVLLFFDWLRFEEVVRNVGCALTWARPQQVSGRYLDQIIGKRTPRIGRNDGQGIRLGGLITAQMLAAGINRSAGAAQYPELLDRAKVT